MFPVAATLREERLQLAKKNYVCIFLLPVHVAADFYSQQSRQQYLDKLLTHKCTHTMNQRAEEQSAGPKSWVLY